MSEIIIITTGGTIDKDYPKPTGGYAFEMGEPAAKRVLAASRASIKYKVIEVMKKDSQDIDDIDRQSIAEACMSARSTRIVITHGTDTMLDTARYLAKRVNDKTIVLTGALKPERFRDSEAAFNIGLALGAVQSLDEGVYIAMSGLVLRWDRCTRDSKTGVFIEV